MNPICPKCKKETKIINVEERPEGELIIFGCKECDIQTTFLKDKDSSIEF